MHFDEYNIWSEVVISQLFRIQECWSEPNSRRTNGKYCVSYRMKPVVMSCICTTVIDHPNKFPPTRLRLEWTSSRTEIASFTTNWVYSQEPLQVSPTLLSSLEAWIRWPAQGAWPHTVFFQFSFCRKFRFMKLLLLSSVKTSKKSNPNYLFAKKSRIRKTLTLSSSADNSNYVKK